jgi:hypothetical protein
MARPPFYPATKLVDAGRSSEEIVELLGKAGCLTAEAFANRPNAVALIDQEMRRYRPSPRGPGDPPLLPEAPGSVPWPWHALQGALRSAGYRGADGARELYAGAASEFVERIIADVRSTDVECRHCQRPLPVSATFCGYCGSRLAQAASASR